MKKILSLATVAAMTLTMMPGAMAEGAAKYTTEKTADGWVKVVNEGGATLGYSEKSGVQLIEADGYAFKDLNQNGALDAYEDWRLPTAERTADLVAQMQGVERANIMAHGGWGAFATDELAEDNTSIAYLQKGGRGGVTRSIGNGGAAHSKWTNLLQEVAESCYYGIPAMISIDPANISGLIECVALGSSMDPALAAAIGQQTAKEYRAAGVTALLGPQVDISSPVMDRAGGTYGEDTTLTLDIATAYVNGMQSTYDADGNDLGWGNESVFCFTKHYAGAGNTEAGRNDHHVSARYAVTPGGNFEAHLITYFDGVFNLPGKTKSSGIMTQYSINVAPDGTRYGGEWSGAYNTYMYGMLDQVGYDSLVITDWGVYTFAGMWGSETLPEPVRIATSWKNGANLLGGYGTMDTIPAAYEALVNDVGQEEADAILSKAAGRYIQVMMDLGMFDNPYTDSAYAQEIVNGEASMAYGLETERKAVAMIKNDGTIKAATSDEKPTVYVPYVLGGTAKSVSWMGGVADPKPTWKSSLNYDTMSKYFNVVTDKMNEDGTDVIRATAEDIAACDYVLIGMTAPYTVSYDSNYISGRNYMQEWQAGHLDAADDVWYPASLQYAEYTAVNARETSIAGFPVKGEGSNSNRSYKGNTAAADTNYGHLEALQYAKSIAGEKPVIVAMQMSRGMVWTEVEPLADVILVSYARMYEDVIGEIVTGKTEPSALLVFQQPKDMDTVEAQFEDVPRDMECYVDANGNTYDFAFGMNWSGVINDERVAKYSQPSLTKVQAFDYAAYEAANK